MSKPMTMRDIEAVYWETVRSQEFYNEQYASDWADELPYATIAQMAVKYFRLRTVLDVGCGLGLVVKHLRKMGVKAYGSEFSDAFLSLSAGEVKRFLASGDITALPFPDNSFDLVICMEVLEHLPVRLVEMAIQELRRVSRANLFVTIPSFGPNDWGPYALPLYEQPWFEDARAGVPFSRIVLDGRNKPHFGHITLASVRWWSDLFLKHDLIRSGQLELAISADSALDIGRWHWNIYCLSKVASAAVEPT